MLGLNLKQFNDFPLRFEVHLIYDYTQDQELFEDTEQMWLAGNEYDYQFVHFPYERFIMYEGPLEDFLPHQPKVEPVYAFPLTRWCLCESAFSYLTFQEDEEAVTEFSPFATFMYNVINYSWDLRLSKFSSLMMSIAFFGISSDQILNDFISSDNYRSMLNNKYSPLYTMSQITSSEDLFGYTFNLLPLEHDYTSPSLSTKDIETFPYDDEVGFLDRKRRFNARLLDLIKESAYDFPLLLESMNPIVNTPYNQTFDIHRKLFLRRADLPVTYYPFGTKLREYDQAIEQYTPRLRNKKTSDVDLRLRFLQFQYYTHIPFAYFEDHTDFEYSWKRNTWALRIKYHYERRKINPIKRIDLKAMRLARQRKEKAEHEEFLALAKEVGKNPLDETIALDSPYSYILEQNPQIGSLFVGDNEEEEERYRRFRVTNFDIGSLYKVKTPSTRRKRGRPKKEISVLEEPVVKRPRGRPKKETLVSEIPVVKRPRGRPKKIKVEEPVVPDDNDDDDSQISVYDDVFLNT